MSFRKAQLKAMWRMVTENEGVISEALKKDLNKCRFDARATEIDVIKNDLRGMLGSIDKWAKPQPRGKSIVTLFDGVYVVPEPYGLTLVIGAWNYPLQLLLGPVIGAIGAGNAVIIKPSDLAPAIAQAVTELLPRYLDKDLYPVVNAGPTEMTELLKERFDYIFYTGSPRVGRIINLAAAEHLTPVTLELGGKSPVYFDDSVTNLEVAFRRILWGKCVNSGQTCIAPDYLLCTKELQDSLVRTADKILKEFFGTDASKSPEYGRIINPNHFK